MSPMTDQAPSVQSVTPVTPCHHGHQSTRRWPLRTGLDLGPLPGAVPCARVHVQTVLWEWGRAELGYDAGLVVTELVTNAVKASRDLRPDPRVPPVRLWLAAEPATGLVLVLVGDASHEPPVHLDLDPGAASGRGLRLVEAMSRRWGWYPAKTAGTVKVVWAEWDRPALLDQADAAGLSV
jgi:hypothetical protein